MTVETTDHFFAKIAVPSARELLLRGAGRVEPGRGAGRGLRGERGGKMTKSECGMTSGCPEWRFQNRLGPLEDGGGEIHEAVSTFTSLAFLPAGPGFIRRNKNAWHLLPMMT
jgi:hypothetical protein